jgi:hypothetical protein
LHYENKHLHYSNMIKKAGQLTKEYYFLQARFMFNTTLDRIRFPHLINNGTICAVTHNEILVLSIKNYFDVPIVHDCMYKRLRFLNGT